ncbi:hydantoinase B/oxoprolinase family protein [Cohnella sp. JJ-181]|uniref:hydantoinase B/oxoprolinase family protein n=1 Tax=Cohnella rhizoplanae TaxID=2974897 RepID=UPI0022FF8507|nr:hydantoinase B/oxoprolinase family protein [Cohnella sp. JJ-181]CAI6084890.1 Acetophenone carboxylase delta subunit [Cohnella sp. JJ-181]
MRIDPALFNIVTNNLLAIAKEMSADLLRSAYSTVIREAADASTFLADAKGRIIAQSQNIPLHMNSVSPALNGALKKINADALTEDDVIILNDPYNGGQHLSDIYLFSPVFWNGQLIAFSGSVGHHVDLGHSPGFNLYARDIFEERMRFTPITFSLSRDWNGGLMEQIIRANIRIPDDTIGDINAQLIANETGRRRLHQLLERYGKESILAICEQFLDYTETAMRRSISQVPDGRYYGTDQADDDGIGDTPVVIQVCLNVSGDTLTVDFEGSSPQVKTAINVPWASTVSSTYSALKMILSDPLIPFNDGAYRPIQITAPKGSIVNPIEFAPVEGRNVLVMRIFQAILKALFQAIPHRVPAPGYDQRTELDMHWRGDKFYAISEQLGGGYGAGPNNDGADQLDDPLGNCKNTPVETLEIATPFLRVTRYELRPDSGGAGATRGGLGAYRSYEFLEDDVHVSVYSDRFKYPAPGILGGHDGACAFLKVTRVNGDEEFLPPKGSAVVHRGDRLEMAIGGGAGYGSPLDRPRNLVELDIERRKVTPEAAEKLYGLLPEKERHL